jgi:hypothetical protein
MDSGGDIFSRARTAASGLKDKAKGYAQKKMMDRMMPKMPGLPGMPNMAGVQGSASKLEKQPILAKIATLVIMTIFIGIFFAYIHKKESTFGYDSLQQGLIVAAIVIIGIGLSFFFKYDMIDFIISSQVNILCFYFLIAYSGLTAIITPSGFFDHFLDIFITAGQIIADPTQIFDKGFSLIIPIIFFIIPLLILLNNLTKNIWLALMVLATSGGVVYVLYPKNSINPIPGGAGFDIGTASCRENVWEIWKKKC